MHGFLTNMKNEMKWREKKHNFKTTGSFDAPKLNAKKPDANAPEKDVMDMREVLSQQEQMLADLKQMNEDSRRATKLNAIEGKMMSGRRLTVKEFNFLRENAPEMYDKAVRIERERNEYERELRMARSKEDVERLRWTRMGMFVAEAGAIRRSDMPKADKKEAMEMVQMRMNAVVNEHLNFVMSSEYLRLADTDEEARTGNRRPKARVMVRKRMDVEV
jgi:hypothetical protein